MEHLIKKFKKLGFNVDVGFNPNLGQGTRSVPYVVTVATDKHRRARFVIELGTGIEALVLDSNPKMKAILLMIRDNGVSGPDRNLAKMLVGHDERQLFVASVPQQATNVHGSMTALKPSEVREAERRSRVKRKRLQRRRNKARVRQGDFFFLPAPDLVVPDKLVLRNEPINRGRGASHMVEFLHRRGGQLVWVCRHRPQGVTPREYRKLLENRPKAKSWDWQARTRNARVFAMGRITHREHATLTLRLWHRVVPNTESGVGSFRDMAFID